MVSLLASVVVGLVVLGVTWRFRLWGIALVLLLLPTYVVRFQIGWLPLTMLEVSIVSLFLGTFFHPTGFKDLLGVARRKDAVLIAGVLLGTGVVATLTAYELVPALGLYKAYLLEPVLVAWVVLATVKRPKDWTVLFWALVVSGTVVALATVAQYVVGWGIPDPWFMQPGRRATAWYGFPNAVGLYIAPLLTLLLAVLLHGKQLIGRHRIPMIVMAVVMSAALVAAQVEGAIIAVGVSLVLLLAFTKWWWFSVAVVVGGLTRLLTHEPTRELLLFQDTSGDVRLAVWEGTWNLLQYNPLFGAGLASFPVVYEFFRVPSHVELLQYPHNIFLNYWVELGLVGLLWLVGVLLFMGIAAWRARHQHRLYALVLLAVLVSTVVYGLVDVPTMKNDLAVLFWVWISLSLCLTKPKHDMVQR